MTQTSPIRTSLVATVLFSILLPLINRLGFGAEFKLSSWALAVVIFLVCMFAFAAAAAWRLRSKKR